MKEREQKRKGRGGSSPDSWENETGLLCQRIENAENWRDGNYLDLWRDCYRRFRSRPETMKKSGSNIFVPQTYMITDVISSRLTESLFASRPYVSVLPRLYEEEDNAKATQALLDWLFAERLGIPRLFREEVVLSDVIYGTVITYTSWSKKVRKVKRNRTREEEVLTEEGLPVYDSSTGAPLLRKVRETIEEERTDYDDPFVQHVDLLNFFVDPQAMDLESARFAGHKEYMTKAAIQNMEKTAGWKVDWENLSPADVERTGQTMRFDVNDQSQPITETFTGGSKGGLYEVHHYWEPDRHAVIINRQQMVLDGKNPFFHGRMPYDRHCYIPLPGEFYGVGVPELTRALQDELNTVRNMRIDYNSMALRRMWKVRKGCGLTPNDLVWRQNGVVMVENLDDVMEIQIAPMAASAFTNEAVIKQDMRDATGCHDILMGLSGNDETATTTMTKDSNASIRFKAICNGLTEDLLLPIAEKCISLCQQYMTEPRQLRINRLGNGEQGQIEQIGLTGEENTMLVDPFSTDGDFELIYIGTSTDPMGNKELTKQNLIQAIGLFFGDEAYQNDYTARSNLMRRVFDSMNLKGVEDLIPKDPAPVQELIQRLQLENQQLREQVGRPMQQEGGIAAPAGGNAPGLSAAAPIPQAEALAATLEQMGQ